MTGVEVGFVIDCGIDGAGVVHRSSFESGELIESGGVILIRNYILYKIG